jgi:hypothetical protein
MRASIIYPLEALIVTLICAGVANLLTPSARSTYSPIGIEWLWSLYAIWGAIIGISGYLVLALAKERWGNAAFRFTTRELVLFTVIVALICGWAVDHANRKREIWRLQAELIKRITWANAK